MTNQYTDKGPAKRNRVRAALRMLWSGVLVGAAALLVLSAMQRGNGGALLLLVPICLSALGYQALQYFRKPQSRLQRRRIVGVWLLGLLLPVLMQSYWHWRQQAIADKAVAALNGYRQHHGHFPVSLAVAGLSDEAAQGLRYQLRPAGPDLRYSATVSPLTEYVYHFDQQRWQRNAD